MVAKQTQDKTNLLSRGFILAVGDVLSDGAAEQHRLLADQADVLPEPVGVQVPDIVAP